MNWSVIIAAFITLLGGTLVYRWQKETDRLTELAKERRQSYREFIEVLDDYMAVFFSSDEEEKRAGYSRYRVAKRKLQLLASSWVLDAVDEHCKSLSRCEAVKSGYEEGLVEDVISAIHKAEGEIVRQMRRDFYFGVTVKLSDLLPLPREVRK